MQKSNSGDRKLLVTAVCFAVPLLTFFAALNGYHISATNAKQFSDTFGVSRAEMRFAPLIARIPATAQIGYLTDLDPSSADYSAAFLAAQYALAPRQLSILGKGPTPEWATGNFSRPVDFAAAGAAHNYEVIADLGTGVVLYRRRSSR